MFCSFDYYNLYTQIATIRNCRLCMGVALYATERRFVFSRYSLFYLCLTVLWVIQSFIVLCSFLFVDFIILSACFCLTNFTNSCFLVNNFDNYWTSLNQAVKAVQKIVYAITYKDIKSMISIDFEDIVLWISIFEFKFPCWYF